MNFFKIPIGVNTRIDDLHFISWTQTQKMSLLWRNFRFRARSNFPKYIENSIFCNPFIFTNFSFTWRQTLARLQTHLGTLYNPLRKVNKKKRDEKLLSVTLNITTQSSKRVNSVCGILQKNANCKRSQYLCKILWMASL